MSEESIRTNGCCYKDDEGPKDVSLQEHICKDSNGIDNAKYESEEEEEENKKAGRGVPTKPLPITELKFNGYKESRGRETLSFTSTPKRRRTYFMANETNSKSRNTTSLDNASQEHLSSSSVSSASDTAGERPTCFSDENDVEYVKYSSPKHRNTDGQIFGYSSAKSYVNRTSYSSLLDNLRVCGNEILRDLGGSISGPEDDCNRPATAGSELTTAAYNNFVRRIVDDTLDRTVTFCEQPRHAITALETICAKAWPRMEMKRHRNRIRAYLKACRRNSKKNKGQINMKEAPMNGLSIEARQLVSNALSLVADDVDQLKRVSSVLITIATTAFISLTC
ncbi:hypothetical protein FBUS_09809 [Fasciolopsis buskii]|uniref:Nucleolar protein 4 helical domain-containing protein n=1 Tax=Fasciolopsis buskii TaxID=27845 RepID=A0A8E0S4H1_9TREM|nr:hypothetical protein FBUS_09809 [Fasciolopsis buski]